MERVIDVTDLRKVYPDGTEAVKGITFHVNEGEFFGFLGPNGAGKSTTIKMLITLLAASGGEALVLGHSIRNDSGIIRRLIGYAAQDVGVDDELTARENLLLQGRLYHLDKPTLTKRVDDLLELMDLARDADRPAGAYSGGMRKRLDLATGLIHRPRVLFLDEPTTGLDPQNRANLWKYLERLNKDEGMTILLTTHYMEEADKLCDRLAIIDHGSIITEGSPTALKASLGGDVISLSFHANGASAEQQRDQAADVVRAMDAVHDVSLFTDGINVVTEEGGKLVPAILRRLDEHGVHVDKLSLTSPTLDDVFLKYTGERIRVEELDKNWRSRRGGMFGGNSRRRG